MQIQKWKPLGSRDNVGGKGPQVEAREEIDVNKGGEDWKIIRMSLLLLVMSTLEGGRQN